MSISLKIEQLDEVEIIPNVVWTLCNMAIEAEVDDDGCITEISMQHTKGPLKDKWLTIANDGEHRGLFRRMVQAIEHEYADRIEKHIGEVNPVESYDRLLPQEMR